MLEEEEGEEEVLGENRIDPLATPLLLSQKPPVLMEEIDPFEPVERRSVYRRKSFLVEFATSKGPPQIVFLILLVALGAGSTIGVVPAVVSDRYARLLHGYTDPRPCSSYNLGSQPPACLDGSADAQNAVALANLVSNWLTFTTSSMIGSISDERGRRGILIFGMFLGMLSPLALVLLQVFEHMSPDWYYIAYGSTGLVSWIAVALSALSDVMPPQWRAASFGLLLAGFGLGIALAPSLAVFFTKFQVSVLALSVSTVGLIFSVLFFPETLSAEASAEARRVRAEQFGRESTAWGRIVWMLCRPLRELSILNRSNLFRLLSLLAFFSGVVVTSDQTLLVYYIEGQLAFDTNDVAKLFALIGVSAIVVQAALLKYLNDLLGERRVLVMAFLMGSINNFLYGIATHKATIFVGVVIAAFSGMSFPTISAIKSNNVNESEQGRVQGALYSVQSLASGLGPVALRSVYRFTKDGAFFGPGSMFVVAALIYVVASVCACALPADRVNSNEDGYESIDSEATPLASDEEVATESDEGLTTTEQGLA